MRLQRHHPTSRLALVTVIVLVSWLVPLRSNPAHADTTTVPAWQVVASPVIPSSDSVLNGVSTDSPKDAWAVGYSDRKSLIERWDGNAWAIKAGAGLQLGTNGSASLNSVAAISDRDVWAVGCIVGHPLIEHWNGQSWSLEASPYQGQACLYGVAATSSRDVWAVGTTRPSDPALSYEVGTLVLHYDGHSWSTLGISPVGTGADALMAVAADAPNDVWAVGWWADKDPRPGYFLKPSGNLVVHWNGKSWTETRAPNADYTNALLGVAAASPTDVWAVGRAETNPTVPPDIRSGEVLHLTAGKWTAQKGFGIELDGVAATSPKNAWMVGGSLDKTGNDITAIYSSTGVGAAPGSVSGYLDGVARIPGGGLWAVGGLEDVNAGDFTPLIMQPQRAVNTTVDSHDVNPGDGVCADANGLCSLRAAIEETNAEGSGTVSFDIKGSGVQTIHLTLGPLQLNKGINVDGTTQKGYAGTPLIKVVGKASDDAFVLDSDSFIKGLIVDGARYGIVLNGRDNTVDLNYIGVDESGGRAQGNQIGVLVKGAGNTIGDASTSPANVISGNTQDGISILGPGAVANTVIGNDVGTDRAGLKAIPNVRVGVRIAGAPSNTIGTQNRTFPHPRLAGNLISGNGETGVFISGAHASYNDVGGNKVGTDVQGMAAIPNGATGAGKVSRAGIYVSAPNNYIGGFYRVESNLISGNTGDGIVVADSGSKGNTIQGDLIGTTADGTKSNGNTGAGVHIVDAPETTIGGSTGPGCSNACNLVSGNKGDGISISGQAASGTRIEGNFIGTDLELLNQAALPNQNGVFIQNGPGTIIGGYNAKTDLNGRGGSGDTAGNLISGNRANGIVITGAQAKGNAIRGNLIGTDWFGSLRLPNGFNGVTIAQAPGNVVGGGGYGNVIAANAENGVAIIGPASFGNQVQGNRIGVEVNDKALGNRQAGVSILNAPRNSIGNPSATTPARECTLLCNVIAGNGADGVSISGQNASDNKVTGNFIGINRTGTDPQGNGGAGIKVDGATETIDQGNVISDNGQAGIQLNNAGKDNVLGNYIGTDSQGFREQANQGGGILVKKSSAPIYIGAPGGVVVSKHWAHPHCLNTCNLISANHGQGGIYLDGASGVVIQGDEIGAAVDGTPSLPNAGTAVYLGGPDNTVGGDSKQNQNYIAAPNPAGAIVIGRRPSGGGPFPGNIVENNIVVKST